MKRLMWFADSYAWICAALALIFVLGFIAGIGLFLSYVFKGVQYLENAGEEMGIFLDAVLPGDEEKDDSPPPSPKNSKKKRGKR